MDRPLEGMARRRPQDHLEDMEERRLLEEDMEEHRLQEEDTEDMRRPRLEDRLEGMERRLLEDPEGTVRRHLAEDMEEGLRLVEGTVRRPLVLILSCGAGSSLLIPTDLE